MLLLLYNSIAYQPPVIVRSLEIEIYERLTGFADLASLVGARVYSRNVLPQGGKVPAVSFYRVSVDRISVMGDDTGLAYARVQVDAWDKTVDGGRVITWNAVFKKAADGAGTANQVSSTRFRYNGTNWIQQGGSLVWFS